MLPDKPVVCTWGNINPFNFMLQWCPGKGNVIEDTLFSYVFCIQNIIKKTVSETSTSLLNQKTRFTPTRIWNQESTSSVTHVSLMRSLIFVFLSASCSWKKNHIQLSHWLICKWFYKLVQSTTNWNSTKVDSLKFNLWVLTQVSRCDDQDSRTVCKESSVR